LKSLLKLMLFAGSAAMSPLMGIVDADAQTAPAQAASPPAAPAPVDTAGPPSLEEVVVTAQHRVEDLQTTPVAVTAFSGAELREKGIDSAIDLNGVAPGVRVGEGSREIEFTIRGITASNVGPQQDAPTAVYLDGIYLSRPNLVGSAFYDMQRVEVLRGPQGTLFGRNADAGAINYISNEPVDQFEGAGEVTVGDYNTTIAKGMLNVPITDDLDARIAFMSAHHDGYEHSLYIAGASGDLDDEDVNAARLHISWRPTDRLTFLLSADTFYSGGAGPDTVDIVATPTYKPDAWVGTNNSPFKANEQGWGVSLNADYDLGFAHLISLSSYRHSFIEDIYDGDFNRGYKNVDRWNPDRSESQEFRIVSNDAGRLNYIGGLYYFQSDDGDNNNLFTNAQMTTGTSTLGPDDIAKSYAAYAQATFKVLDSFRLTGGIRYTQDHKEIDGRYSTTNEVSFTGYTVIPGSFVHADFSKVTYRAGAEWDLTSENMLYATVSTGYKSGGVNATTISDLVGYQPETITSYEIGSKNQFFDRRLRLNIDLFDYDYRNVQLNSTLDTSGSTVRLTTNGGTARIYGAELESIALVTDQFRIEGNLSYLPEARFTSMPAFLDVLNNNDNADLSGRRMPNTPRFTINLSPIYTIGVTGGKLSLRSDFQYTSDQVFTPFGLTPYVVTPPTGAPFVVTNNIYANGFQKSYTRTNMRLRYENDKNWYVEGYCNNVENRQVLDYVGFSATENAGSYEPPRTLGATVGVKF